jgi:putative endonuclease
MITNQRHTVIYTGVTNDLERRIFEHITKLSAGFTSKYNCDKLIYFEEFAQINEAISREKQLKKWRRVWKEELINKTNPEWNDLSLGWYHPDSITLAKKLNKENK